MSSTAVATTETKSILVTMSKKYGMEPSAFEATVRQQCSPTGRDARELTREEFAALMLVANEYSLNPITREIYAFPKRGGGIVPIVSVDGWVSLVNSHSAMDGLEFAVEHDANGKLVSCTCRIFRKDRSKPIEITEYLAECIRETEPWKMKHRMLRHKALIQCARYAFGFSGIYDEDEGERIISNSEPVAPPPEPPPVPPADAIDAEFTEAKTTTAQPSPLEALRTKMTAAMKKAKTAEEVMTLWQGFGPEVRPYVPDKAALAPDKTALASLQAIPAARKAEILAAAPAEPSAPAAEVFDLKAFLAEADAAFAKAGDGASLDATYDELILPMIAAGKISEAEKNGVVGELYNKHNERFFFPGDVR